MSEIEVFEGSGNIFADLGLPDADDMLLKANLVARLRALIADRKITQTKAAKMVGMGQADLSKLLRGSLRGYSVERLMKMLTAFDQDILISVRPHAKSGEGGQIIFSAVPA